MRAARGFIKFKIQISKFKGEKRGGSEGERGRGGEEVRGQRSEVRGQGSGGGQEREILNFEF
jgi:hypothetical protein